MNIAEMTSINDFKDFVQKLTPEEIQNWSTDDWLRVYEKIENIRTAQKTYISPFYLANKECVEEFTKLYQNYKFDADELQVVRKMAKKVGEELAKQGKIDLAEIMRNNEQIDQQMKTVIDSVQEISQMPHEVEFKTEWGDPYKGVRGCANYLSITLFRNMLRDQALVVTAHEAAHSLLQRDASSNVLKEDYKERELSHSDAFSKLMDYNRGYYISSDGGIYFNGYKHQPIEKHANFFGYFCERSFREKAGQPTERCAMEFLNIIDKPLRAYYENSNVVMEYTPDNLQKIEGISAIIPTEYLKYEQKNDIVCVKIKSGIKLSGSLKKLRAGHFKIGQDISIQQYINHPFLSRYISIPSNMELLEKADFSHHSNIKLVNANCKNCAELILPRNKSIDEWYWSTVSDTELPEKLDCNKGNVIFNNCDFSRVKEMSGYKSVIAINEASFGDDFDFSEITSVKFENVDLSNLKNVKWPNKIASLQGCKLPENVDLSDIKSVNLCGADLSKTKSIKLPENIDNIVISNEMFENYPILKTAITVVKEMKKMKNLYAKKSKKISIGRQSNPKFQITR